MAERSDVIIVGASASGLMCAIEAAKRGRRVLVLDHANRAGKKILMSGGGRCNFTNLDISADNYISHNPHFCKSALSRYTQWDFIALVDAHNIDWEERELGKLFCKHSAKEILAMLLDECGRAGVRIQLNSTVQRVEKKADGFSVTANGSERQGKSLVIASGGLSIPKMCASPFGYQVAEQFGHHIWPTRAALVPFTLQPDERQRLQTLAGISVDCDVSNARTGFRGNILFTHRGISGPAVLQISSYWQPGETISINLLPDCDLGQLLTKQQSISPNIKLKTLLAGLLAKRLLPCFLDEALLEKPLQEISRQAFKDLARRLQQWQLKPGGTEGYRTAEVTLGGVDCNELSSKTMASNKV
ncbi:MAG TPA: NAD(P)/FAD-dependent oxidoreductase, partial [Thiotrichales bacterium]|nr:NAD(P)/FAD-dependent oxidoreductase [Thiotrichales bacterium]